MALLTNKPSRVVLNTQTALTLNRAELAAYFAATYNSYFSDTNNWDKVYFYYKDSTGTQNFSLYFNNGGLSQGIFSSSSRVKQSKWYLDKIIVRGFDRNYATIKRGDSFLTLSEGDIVVAVANRTPSAIFLSNTSAPENQTFVGNLTATDPDIEDPLTYSVISAFNDGASFKIVGNNALHFVTAPNFEVKNQFSVKIRVTDSSDAFYEQAFTINVIDVNEAPSNITLSNNTINENSSINTVIGTLTATDEDAGATHTFSIVGGDTSSFNISGNQLRSSVSFDYETKASYTVTIRATDNGGLTYDKVFNISVLNVNEAPTGITLSNNSVNEQSSVNTVVGVFTTTDVDGNDTFTYTLISGDTTAFNINSNQLRTSQVFDFETKSSYSVTVRSTDAGGLSTTQTFTINVNNIAEAPTNISLTNNTIDEYTQPINTVIGTLSATTPTAQAVSYSLVGGDVASFNINGTQLRSSVVFDYEIKSSYSITIRASTGGEYFDKTFTIYVNNVTGMQFWTTSNNLNAVKSSLSGLGTQSSALAFGGVDTNSNILSTSEKFDGNTWSSSANTNNNNFGSTGVGTQNAGLSFSGQYIKPGEIVYSKAPPETFNGSSWSIVQDSSLYRISCGGAGTQAAALAFGGTDGGSNIWYYTESFNGSTWTTLSGNLNFNRYNLRGCGTQSAALSFGGTRKVSGVTTITSITEKFDGSTWSNSGNLNSTRTSFNGCGTQNAAIAFGGHDGNSNNVYSTTESFNGSTWSVTTANLNTPRYALAGAGNPSSASLSFGGRKSPYTSDVVATTEKYIDV